MTKLPRKWVEVTLDDVASHVTSGSRDWSKYYSNEGALFIRTENINKNELCDILDISRVSLPEHVEGKRSRVCEGDILITITGANVGKCAEVRGELPEAYVSQSIALVRLVDRSMASFLQRQLTAKDDVTGSTLLEQRAYGVGRPVLSLGDVREVPIRLAPVLEQGRIVAKLGALTASVDRARAELDRVPQLCRQFRLSFLKRVFSGGTPKSRRQNSDWLQLPAVEVCGKVQSGGTPKGGFALHGVPFLKVYNLVDQAIDFDHRPQYVTPAINESELRKSMARPGDVLMNIVGPPLGKVAIVPEHMRECNFNQALTMFRPSERVTSKWIYYFLCSGLSVDSVVGETRGIAGQVNISLSQCRAFIFPVPPIDEQELLVRDIEAAFARADRLEAEAARARALLDRLEAAVLAKAFRGELVPQDPNDEPASVLLERIRARRAAAPKAKRGRRQREPADA